jgi:hypothetical protein
LRMLPWHSPWASWIVPPTAPLGFTHGKAQGQGYHNLNMCTYHETEEGEGSQKDGFRV